MVCFSVDGSELNDLEISNWESQEELNKFSKWEKKLFQLFFYLFVQK